MPSLNIENKSLRYSATDATALDKAVTLVTAMRDYDAAAQADANTALPHLKSLQQHVHRKRNAGKPAAV